MITLVYRQEEKNLKIHFLKISEDGKGDCTLVELPDGEFMMIDVRNARNDDTANTSCENPIKCLESVMNTRSFHRYIQTHPDMDHMDGFNDLRNTCSIINFWDTENNKQVDDFEVYREEDWEKYQNPKPQKMLYLTRSTNPVKLKSGESYIYEIYALSPTEELVKQANESENYNILSYVVLLCYKNCKILFGGDIESSVWVEIESWMDSNDKANKLLSNVTIFKASHHGRDSGYCGNSFLKKINPRFIILDDNVKSEESAYEKYKNFLGGRDPSGWIYSVGKETVLAEYKEGDGTTMGYKSKW